MEQTTWNVEGKFSAMVTAENEESAILRAMKIVHRGVLPDRVHSISTAREDFTARQLLYDQETRAVFERGLDMEQEDDEPC